ncbi:MAG: selenocysteine-specific translation elongation factor [Pirellulales bacterium]
MINKHFILGMAGHIDHGKSALVQALTGTDPDRLPEEKSRGMTIDLGFAQLELVSRSSPDTCYQIGIVDVPGHAGFINNMVSGIGAIDVALMVVAADDGWMPQTEEHLQILEYLGIQRVIIGLTKADRSNDLEQVTAQIRERLTDSPYANAPIIPTAIFKDGTILSEQGGLTEQKSLPEQGGVQTEGIDRLREALVELLDQAPSPANCHKPRLSVDRVFTLAGRGTIVTGTLTGGTLQQGQAVVVQPAGITTRIRSLQSHDQSREQALPGMRTAINLADGSVASKGRAGIARGVVITSEESGSPTDTFHALLKRTTRGGNKAYPLKHATRIRLHHGGTQVPAKLHFIQDESLAAGAGALAQIRLEQPLLVFMGDRFLIRNWAKSATLAGGIVLEPHAERRHYRSVQQLASLKVLADAVDDPQLAVKQMLVRWQPVLRRELLRQSHFSTEQIETAVAALVQASQLRIAGDYLTHLTWWKSLLDRAQQMVVAEHQENPHLAGLPLTRLRSELALDSPALFDELVRDLSQQDIVQVGDALRSNSHLPELPSHLAAAGKKIRQMLADSPFKPPSRKELADNKAANDALRFLIQQGEVVEIDAKVALLAATCQQAREQVHHYLTEHATATMSELRELLGTNRKVIVPLMEQFDREGLTVRKGNVRQLK